MKSNMPPSAYKELSEAILQHELSIDKIDIDVDGSKYHKEWPSQYLNILKN